MRVCLVSLVFACLLLVAGLWPAQAAESGGWFSFWNSAPAVSPGEKPSLYNKVVPEKRKAETEKFIALSPAEQWAIANEIRAPQMEQVAKNRAVTRKRLALLDQQNRMSSIEAQAKGRKAFEEQKRREKERRDEDEAVPEEKSEAPRIYLTPEDAGKPTGVFQDYQ